MLSTSMFPANPQPTAAWMMNVPQAWLVLSSAKATHLDGLLVVVPPIAGHDDRGPLPLVLGQVVKDGLQARHRAGLRHPTLIHVYISRVEAVLST